MRSTISLPSLLSTSALLLAVNFLVGCDSADSSKVVSSNDSPSKVASNEDPSKVASDESPSKVDPAPSAEATSPAGENQLTIGSTAPPLDIEHWLSDGDGKFAAVTNFESGKVYVVEFWATWCGPCIASMPHLVELQETYADQGVQIISISNEDIDTVKSMLSKPYKSSEDGGPSTYGELTNAYCLTTDPDLSAHKDYLQAAKQDGIPCAFIVGKSGLIEYIGHPMGMDDVLQQVIDDKWDRQEFADSFASVKIIEKLQRSVILLASQGKLEEARVKLAEAKGDLDAEFSPMLKELEATVSFLSVEQMIKAGRADDAIAEVQRELKNGSSKLAPMWSAKLIQLLIQKKRYEDAAAKMNDLLNILPAQLLNQIAWETYEHAADSNEIPDELLNAAIAASEKAVDEIPDHGPTLDTLAHLLHQSGDLDRAIKVQKKAMENPLTAEAEIEAFLQQLLKEKEEDEKEEGDDS